MTTPQQLKAARALIGWTQSQLAKASGLHVNAVNNVERGLSTPRNTTLQKMQAALEQGGVTFIAGRGVELRDHAIETRKISGKTLLQHVFDDIISAMQSPADDIISLIADLPAFTAFDAAQIRRYASEKSLTGWQERILTANTHNLTAPEGTTLRTLPQHRMGQVDILVYADRTAFIHWAQQEAVILKNRDLAFTQKTFLEDLWASAT